MSSPSRSPPRRRGDSRRRSVSRDHRRDDAGRSNKRQRRSPSPAGSASSGTKKPRPDDQMDVDKFPKGELKIKGQAEVERKKSNWDDDLDSPVYIQTQEELERRENELKEKALRNKVMRSRKAT
ncbi:hypothetical protein EYR40_010779 [Pleurotus pulmonarius]|nr:hypothetical protein EYR36_002550 [Pleurotus pulmonarius]KAF4586764.1 hypothetical protein EYR40_010779 [Pleurotus pulmonarius]